MQGTRWTVAVAAALVAVTVLGACGGNVTGSGAITSAPSSSRASSSSQARSTPSSQAPTSSQPTSAATSKQATTALRDFTRATYTVPRGFTRGYSYSEAIELERDYTADFFVPKAAYNGRDVLTVLVYTLPGDVHVDTPEQQAARVDYYNKKLSASLPNGTRDSTIAGLPAFQENVVQPPDYHYSTWFAFGARHVLQFSCQVGTTKSAAPVIANACQTMHDSIRVS